MVNTRNYLPVANWSMNKVYRSGIIWFDGFGAVVGQLRRHPALGRLVPEQHAVLQACAASRQSLEPCQPTFLVFKLHPPRRHWAPTNGASMPTLGRQQSGIHLIPIDVSRLTDPCLAADLGHQRALFACLMMNAFCAPVDLLAFIRFRSSPS